MIIRIITNTFGKYKRQDIAVDSWKYLKDHFKNTEHQIEIFDLQFRKDESQPYEGVTTVHDLDLSSESVIEKPSKKLPFVNEILMKGFINENHPVPDYVIFTNSDVIIMPNLIYYIINAKPKAMACSRLDIQDINSFQDVLNENVKAVRYEIAGFDTFIFEKDWLTENMRLFSTPYFLGKHLWDVVWAGYIQIFGDNQPLGNKYPPYCFHIHHGLAAVTTECPEKDWNTKKMKQNPYDTLMNKIISYNLKKNLIQRTPWGAFIQPTPDEQKFENEYFGSLNIHTT